MSNKERLVELLEEAAALAEDIDAPEMRPPGERVPMQPIVLAPDGVVRFRPNAIVKTLLAVGPLDMNKIAMLPGVSREDHAQFAQLIGYSVIGYGELSYALNVDEADEVARKVLEASKP